MPSIHLTYNSDCIIIDYLIETETTLSIADIVLKLRVCGYNAVIVVLINENPTISTLDIKRNIQKIKDLSLSNMIDIILQHPFRSNYVKLIDNAIKKKYIKQLFTMNGN